MMLPILTGTFFLLITLLLALEIRRERRLPDAEPEPEHDEKLDVATAQGGGPVTEQKTSTQGEEGHRVVLRFEGGLYAELICPTNGCKQATECDHCSADLTDAGSKRCYVCEETNPGECWLKGWFEEIPAEELLHGCIEVPIWTGWDGDHPLVHIEQPASSSEVGVTA